MKRLLFLFLTMSAIGTFAQDRTFYERLHGTNLRGTLLLKLNRDSTLWYKSEAGSWYPAKDKIFNAANYNHDNTVNVYMAFSNPLRDHIVIEHREETDLSLAVLDQYFDGVSGTMMGLVDSVYRNEFKYAGSNEKENGADGKMLKSVHFAQWWFSIMDKIKDHKNHEELRERLDTIGFVERFIYEPISLPLSGNRPAQRGRVSEILKTGSEAVKGAETYALFVESTSVLKEILGLLKSRVETCELTVDHVRKLFTENAEQLILVNMKYTSEGEKEYFLAYSRQVATRELGEISNKLNTIMDAIRELENIVKEAESHAKAYDYIEEFGESGHFRLMKTDSFKYNRKTTSHYTVSVRTKDETLRKTEFSVAKKLAMVPFAATGLTYTNFRYPEYSLTQSDTGSVVNMAETDPSLKISAFLNLAFPMRYAGVYPYLQLGLSVGESDMVIPLGGGFILFDKFSLSAGTMLGYHKDLQALRVGDRATQDQFDADVRRNVFGFNNWYFSVNYTLAK